MGSLLTKVKAKMSIYAHQKVQGLLEGEYGSVFKGRSMDFDDLRQYVPGDDVKDIDWKATARSGQTLIKRYIAVRKHNILLVVDTGRNMAAVGASGESKRDVTIMVAGVMGYIAQKHGDLVAMVSGDDESTHYLPLKGTSEHLERLLQHIEKNTRLDAPSSNLAKQLDYIARTIRRRMMIVIVSDDIQIDESYERLLRRLGAQHELMWISIGDAGAGEEQLKGKELYDIGDNTQIPAFLLGHKKVIEEFIVVSQQQTTENQKQLGRLRISSQRVVGEADAVTGLFKLLEKQRYARR
ncbi:DUF58 domain-containing protein [Microbacteriaceae bacterium]|nr:DUF58 domain-containing protein [Candidatus Saccharibacteria bacterium]